MGRYSTLIWARCPATQVLRNYRCLETACARKLRASRNNWCLSTARAWKLPASRNFWCLSTTGAWKLPVSRNYRRSEITGNQKLLVSKHHGCLETTGVQTPWVASSWSPRRDDDFPDAQAPGPLTRLRESSVTAQAEALQLHRLVRPDSEEDPLKSTGRLRRPVTT